MQTLSVLLKYVKCQSIWYTRFFSRKGQQKACLVICRIYKMHKNMLRPTRCRRKTESSKRILINPLGHKGQKHKAAFAFLQQLCWVYNSLCQDDDDTYISSAACFSYIFSAHQSISHTISERSNADTLDKAAFKKWWYWTKRTYIIYACTTPHCSKILAFLKEKEWLQFSLTKYLDGQDFQSNIDNLLLWKKNPFSNNVSCV